MSRPIRRILIADDHDMIRRGVRALIETRSDFEVVAEVAGGRAALDEAERTRPDIAILDHSMPDLNGLDLTRALKRALPRIAILIYTMHEREDLMVDVLRAGARGFVLKTDSEQHILAAVDAIALGRTYFSESISESAIRRSREGALPASSAPSLTRREREIVQMIAEGRINKEIGRILNISIKTVESHRAAAMHKLELKTTADLVRYAVRNAIVGL